VRDRLRKDAFRRWRGRFKITFGRALPPLVSKRVRRRTFLRIVMALQSEKGLGAVRCSGACQGLAIRSGPCARTPAFASRLSPAPCFSSSQQAAPRAAPRPPRGLL
jgi:hypothetical protein